MTVIDLLEARRRRQSRETPVDEQCLRQSLAYEMQQIRFWSKVQTLLLVALVLRSLL